MNDDKSHIGQLEELTENLQFDKLIICTGCNCFEVPGIVGRVYAFTLYKDNKIAIARSYGEKGTVLPFHSHKGKEWFGTIEGKVKLTFEDGEVIFLEEGQGYEIRQLPRS
jgi:hypothetical protein